MYHYSDEVGYVRNLPMVGWYTRSAKTPASPKMPEKRALDYSELCSIYYTPDSASGWD